MSIDYARGMLYWVDDYKDTIEWTDFDGKNHGVYDLGAHEGYHTLFGVTVFKVLVNLAIKLLI